jgi:Flp pilus assembly pilin Flp
MAYIYWKVKNRLLELGKDNSGVAVVEIILILVVLIGLVVVFKNEAASLVTKIWKAITEGSNKITG